MVQSGDPDEKGQQGTGKPADRTEYRRESARVDAKRLVLHLEAFFFSIELFDLRIELPLLIHRKLVG